MTWWKTAVYWALFLLMVGWYAVFERRPAPAPEAESARQRVIPAFSDEIVVFTVEQNGRVVRVEKRDKRWRVVQPEGASVPHDLVAALVETLTEKQEAEVVAEAPDAEALRVFGLEEPRSRILLQGKDGKVVAVEVGEKNPPRTAIYVKTDASPHVLLAGLNVEYYGDLVVSHAYPSK